MQLDLLENKKEIKATPFLRWAGGKNWFVKYIVEHLPPRFNNYHEPFLGGGSVFFSITCKKKCYLSDLNFELIDTYLQIRDNTDKVINQLKKFKNTEEEYYQIRERKYTDNHLKAAQFIYLNMTSFNGIYRVNRSGKYNVPYGNRKTIDFVQEDTIRAAGRSLQNVTLKSQDFDKSLKKVKKGDFVFVDPPYTVAHEKNGFIAYNQKIFSLEDQYRLADSLKTLNKMGAYFLLTNAYHAAIREIYQGVGSFLHLQRKSLIGGKGAVRDDIKEYIIKNF